MSTKAFSEFSESGHNRHNAFGSSQTRQEPLYVFLRAPKAANDAVRTQFVQMRPSTNPYHLKPTEKPINAVYTYRTSTHPIYFHSPHSKQNRSSGLSLNDTL